MFTMSAVGRNVTLLKALTLDFSNLRLAPAAQQAREYIHRPKLRNPHWFVRKTRVATEDNVTTENQEFIKEIIHDKYGPPAIIKGVATYKNAAPSLVKMEERENVEWSPKLRRAGLVAKKIGNYPLWLKNGKKIHTTLLQVIDNHVIKYTPPEQYNPAQRPRVHDVSKFGCLLIGAETADPSLLTKEYCGIFKDSGVVPKKHIGRFLVSPEAALMPGTPLNVTHFRVGDFIDVRGNTIDRGFQGVMKRHGFKGMPASHGVTKTHRRPGNIGGGGEKGRVWPGTKMPGHMGNRYRILRGLRIWRMNTKYNVMWVQGYGIAGETNSIVYCYDTMLPLRKPKAAPPFPTSFDDELADPLPDEIWYESVHDFKDPSIRFEPAS